MGSRAAHVQLMQSSALPNMEKDDSLDFVEAGDDEMGLSHQMVDIENADFDLF